MNRGAISTVVAIALVLVSCSQQTDNAKSMATKSPDGSNNSASTAQNSTVGVVELEKRVASGDMQATYELVGRYLLGKGVERDRRKALALLSGRNVETDRRLLRLKTDLIIELDEKSHPDYQRLLEAENKDSEAAGSIPEGNVPFAIREIDQFTKGFCSKIYGRETELLVSSSAWDDLLKEGQRFANESKRLGLGSLSPFGEKTKACLSEFRKTFDSRRSKAIELAALGAKALSRKEGIELEILRYAAVAEFIENLELEPEFFLGRLADRVAALHFHLGESLKLRTILQQYLQQANLAHTRNRDAADWYGWLLWTGKGGPKDFEGAVRYLELASSLADQTKPNSHEPEELLANAYLYGLGVPNDLIRAYVIVNHSGDNIRVPIKLSRKGYEFDSSLSKRELLAHLESKMTPEQIALAQRATASWKKGETLTDVLGRHGGEGTVGVGPRKIATGTLFVVSGQGVGVTNQHVVANCNEIRIEGRDGIAKKLSEDVTNDLALIKIPGEFSVSAPIVAEPSKLRQGDEIVVFGFPLNSVLSSGGNLTPGVVSALAGLGNNTNQIQITAAIQPGSSGSPVLNRKGEVIGVVVKKISDAKMVQATGQVAQTVNFAVGGQTLRSFLDANNVSYKSGASWFAGEKNLADIGDQARKWTLLLECWK